MTQYLEVLHNSLIFYLSQHNLKRKCALTYFVKWVMPVVQGTPDLQSVQRTAIILSILCTSWKCLVAAAVLRVFSMAVFRKPIN